MTRPWLHNEPCPILGRLWVRRFFDSLRPAGLQAWAAFMAVLTGAFEAWAGPEYEPYRPSSGEAEVSAPLHVVLSYGIIWLVVLLFVASVWHRQRKLQAELAELRSEIERRT